MSRLAVCQRIEEGADAEQEPEYDGVAHADDAGHEGAFGGAAHLSVYVAVEHHVEDAGAAGGHVSADEDAEEGEPGGQAAGGDEHGADRGEEEEGDNFGFGQGQVVAPGGGGQTGSGVDHEWLDLFGLPGHGWCEAAGAGRAECQPADDGPECKGGYGESEMEELERNRAEQRQVDCAHEQLYSIDGE